MTTTPDSFVADVRPYFSRGESLPAHLVEMGQRIGWKYEYFTHADSSASYYQGFAIVVKRGNNSAVFIELIKEWFGPGRQIEEHQAGFE